MHRAGFLLNALRTEWVENALGVSRAAVANWRGGKFPSSRQDEIADAVRALLPEYEPDAPPAWAERVLIGLFALEAKLGVTDAELEAARVEAAAAAAIEAELGPPQPEADGVAGVGSA